MKTPDDLERELNAPLVRFFKNHGLLFDIALIVLSFLIIAGFVSWKR